MPSKTCADRALKSRIPKSYLICELVILSHVIQSSDQEDQLPLANYFRAQPYCRWQLVLLVPELMERMMVVVRSSHDVI